MRSILWRIHALVLSVGIIGLSVPEDLNAGPADVILAGKNDNDKFALIKRSAADMSVADMVALVQKEKSARVLGFLFGALLENKGADDKNLPKNLAAALKASGNREPIVSRLIALCAIAPEASEICTELVKGTDPYRNQQAARIFATNAWTREQTVVYRQSLTGKLPKAKGKAKGGKNAEWDEKFITRLIEDPSDNTKEMAIIGAAYLNIEGVKEVVEAHKASRVPGVRAARLLYRAHLDLPLTEEDLQLAFETSPAVKPGFDKPGVLFSTYDVQTSPWCVACEAIGKLGKEEYLPYLLKALNHADLRVQLEAVWAMEKIGSTSPVAALLAKLPKAEWPVRVAIYSALGAIPTKESIPALITRFGMETGRCRMDAIYALASIAGDQMKLDRPTEWEDWWQKTEKTFEISKDKTKSFRAKNRIGKMTINYEIYCVFYKLPIYSAKFIFTPDTSASMKGAKFESLKREFTESLRTASMNAFWNIVNFGGVVDVMAEGKLLDYKQLPQAKTRIESFQLTGGTRIYDALDLAFTIPGCEEIILLSDGAPAGGTFTAWPRVYAGIALLNRYRMLAIDTLEYAEKDDKPVGAGMKELADRNRGRAVHAVALP